MALLEKDASEVFKSAPERRPGERLIDPYYSTNLERIFDVNETGRAFYTLRWEREVHEGGGFLEFGSNYRATVDVDGVTQNALTPFAGMWSRQRYLIEGGLLGIVIEPPDHCGSAKEGGQGGDHELAKDLSAQFLLGWDWQAAIPDRSTGFFGSVDFFEKELFVDTAILTLAIDDETVRLRAVGAFIGGGHVVIEINGEKVAEVETDGSFSIDFDMKDMALWWPRGVSISKETAVLHTATFSSKERSRCFKFGIRTFESFIDAKTKGTAIRVNGVPFFLVGGNWIHSDAMWRFSGDRRRYEKELQLHVEAGFNAIRVWGGGVIETDSFYEVADDLGLVVYQELGFTGDNNGRWAGSFDWPLDQDGAKEGVRQSVRRLRRFASFMLLGGGNELYPSDKSPPSYITEVALEELTSTLYVRSSMDGGLLGGDSNDHDDNYALAPKDGPYSMLLPHMFSQRNPGLERNLHISFQPEIGSCAIPNSQKNLLKMMTETEASTIILGGNNLSEAWTHHRFEAMTLENKNYDFAEAYGFSSNSSDWLLAANLALHQQTQLLIESFAAHLFEWYAAVYIWKTQSPWPSLRGYLYDYWLEANGNWRGARMGNRMRTLTYDYNTSTVRLVNRDALESWRVPEITFEYIEFTKGVVSKGRLMNKSVPPLSAVDIGRLAPCNATFCFLRLRADQLQNVYWISSNKNKPDYSAIGLAQKRRAASAKANVSCDDRVLHVDLSVSPSSEDLLFYPQIEGTLFVKGDDALILLPGETAHYTIPHCLTSPMLLIDAINLYDDEPLRLSVPSNCLCGHDSASSSSSRMSDLIAVVS